MFGLLVAGRLPQNNFQRISENQLVVEVLDIEHINHVVVYMTGEMPFPEGFAGAVYLCITVGNEQRWIYLGKISNDRPSEIFKISNLTHETSDSAMQLFASAMEDMQPHISRGMIGISVEPLANINNLTPATEMQTAASIGLLNEFTQKMLENFYNYASSFSKDAPDGRSYVPLTSLQTWFENFKRRLEMNPNFWRSQ